MRTKGIFIQDKTAIHSSIWGGKASQFFIICLLSLFAAVHPAAAQSTSTASVTTTSDADQDWVGVDPSKVVSSDSATNVKTVYFYNVGKKMFLGRGGRWGTEAVLSEVGQPFIISSNNSGYVFQSNATELSGDTNKGYLYTPGTNAAYDKLNFFSDAQSGTIFYVETVDNSANKYIYKISCYRASDTQTTSKEGTKYYMVGAYNSNSSSIKDLSSTAINCIENTTSYTDSTDCWILVSQKERHNKFKTNANSRFCHVPGTALIYDDDFARKDQTISYWKQADDNTSLTQGWSATLPASSTTTTYYVGNGIADDQQISNGAYMAANMIGASGTIQQTIENVFIPGWYEIRCNAFTTSTKGKVVLFAQTGNGTANGKTSSEYDEAHATVFSGTRPTTYLATAKEVADSKYQISVCVKVSEKTIQDDDDVACNPLTFGVTISDGENTDLTTIDNFELVYRGKVVDKIVLDETNEGKEEYKEVALTTSGTTLQENVNYMQAQNNIRTQESMCEVYIKRTMKKDQWNSIILPFRLTNGDVKAMWGDDAVVTEFKGARDENNPHYIYFDKTTDGIYPGKLYLVKPTALNTETLSSDVESSNAINIDGKSKITLEANTPDVYHIDAPRYGVDANEKAVTYTNETIKGDTGKEWYDDVSKQLQFAGTYFKGMGNVPGNSYYIANNKWYYSGKNVTNNSKGFRAWIQQATSTSDNSEAKGYTFYINGINSTDENTTVIESITNGSNALPASFDVYTIGGQKVRSAATSLDGLAKGVYIVNGKKYVKR